MLKVGAERPDTGYLDISRARKGSESLKASSCWYDRHQIRSWVAGLTSTRLLKAMCIYDQFKVVVGAKKAHRELSERTLGDPRTRWKPSQKLPNTQTQTFDHVLRRYETLEPRRMIMSTETNFLASGAHIRAYKMTP